MSYRNLFLDWDLKILYLGFVYINLSRGDIVVSELACHDLFRFE